MAEKDDLKKIYTRRYLIRRKIARYEQKLKQSFEELALYQLPTQFPQQLLDKEITNA